MNSHAGRDNFVPLCINFTRHLHEVYSIYFILFIIILLEVFKNNAIDIACGTSVLIIENERWESCCSQS